MIITDAPHRKLAALVALVVVTGPATARLFYASPAQWGAVLYHQFAW